MNLKLLIKSWFEANERIDLSFGSQPIVMRNLMNNLKKNGVKGSDIDEEAALLILDKLTPKGLPDIARMQVQEIMILDLDLYRRTILNSESGYQEVEYVAPEVVISAPRAARQKPSTDEYLTMDKSECIEIDRSEIKDKEFDVEFLKGIGIDVKDLTNE